MYPTWSIVFAALIAGALGGFLIPERPQSKPATVATTAKETAEKASNPNKPAAGSPAQPAPDRTDRTEPKTQPAAEQKQASKAESCAIDNWPYRATGCLDRTASIAPAHLTVNARRVDPTIGLRDMNSAGNEIAATKQKTVPALPAQEAAPARAAEANTTENAAETKKPRRRTYRPPAPYFVEESWRGRERTQERGQERVYFRGHDGRFYLAPEYRPGPPPVYYIR